MSSKYDGFFKPSGMTLRFIYGRSFNDIEIELNMQEANFIVNHVNDESALKDYITTLSDRWVWKERE